MNNLLYRFAQIISEDDISGVPKFRPGESTVTNGMQIVLGIFSAVAVLIIAISAFRIVISRGNSQDVQKARDAIIYAAVGLVISMAAFIIVTFVVERI